MKRKSTVKNAIDVSEGLVTITEAAEFLSLSPSTIVIMLRRKELPCCVIAGRSRRIPKAALIRYVNDRLKMNQG